MSLDRRVPRDSANLFHDITILGNKIRNRLVSWNNQFMSVGCRRALVKEAKRLLPSLKEALDTIKPTLQDEADIIDFDWHMYRHKDLTEKYNTLESSIIPPLSNTPPPELNSDEKSLSVTPSYLPFLVSEEKFLFVKHEEVRHHSVKTRKS